MNYPSPACVVFLSLKCNFTCRYCTLHPDHQLEAGYVNAPGEKWLKALNGLSNIKLLRFAGGQPTAHPDFVEIVNGINLPGLEKMEIICNGSNHAMAKLLDVKPRANLRIQLAYHLPQVEDHSHLSITQDLQKVHRRVEARIVADESDETCFGPRRRITWSNRESGEVQLPVDCLPASAPVAPDGDIYYCHSLMFRHDRKGVVGNIFDGWYHDLTHMFCPDVGFCHPDDGDHVILKPET